MVPKGWKKRDLHKLITIKHGFAFKSEYFSNDGQYVLLTPEVLMSQVGSGTKVLKRSSIVDLYLMVIF